VTGSSGLRLMRLDSRDDLSSRDEDSKYSSLNGKIKSLWNGVVTAWALWRARVRVREYPAKYWEPALLNTDDQSPAN
jgi:hypothetical protein